MSIQQFIRSHRTELDQYIRAKMGRPQVKLSDANRREWILNDEPLYRWAQAEGVRI